MDLFLKLCSAFTCHKIGNTRRLPLRQCWFFAYRSLSESIPCVPFSNFQMHVGMVCGCPDIWREVFGWWSSLLSKIWTYSWQGKSFCPIFVNAAVFSISYAIWKGLATCLSTSSVHMFFQVCMCTQQCSGMLYRTYPASYIDFLTSIAHPKYSHNLLVRYINGLVMNWNYPVCCLLKLFGSKNFCGWSMNSHKWFKIFLKLHSGH